MSKNVLIFLIELILTVITMLLSRFTAYQVTAIMGLVSAVFGGYVFLQGDRFLDRYSEMPAPVVKGIGAAFAVVNTVFVIVATGILTALKIQNSVQGLFK